MFQVGQKMTCWKHRRRETCAPFGARSLGSLSCAVHFRHLFSYFREYMPRKRRGSALRARSWWRCKSGAYAPCCGGCASARNAAFVAENWQTRRLEAMRIFRIQRHSRLHARTIGYSLPHSDTFRGSPQSFRRELLKRVREKYCAVLITITITVTPLRQRGIINTCNIDTEILTYF